MHGSLESKVGMAGPITVKQGTCSLYSHTQETQNSGEMELRRQRIQKRQNSGDTEIGRHEFRRRDRTQ